MSKFHIGQKVKVKSLDYLQAHQDEPPTYNSDMEQYADTVQVVERYSDGHDDWVMLKDVCNSNDDWQWRWHEDWLEPVAELDINAKALEDLLNG